ncbi:potassium transporter TrkG, partial [Thiolapillus sp.]|uniref:potassium transporter TrkG n=2 Tax=Thiolapillus sp. TaxID=2017437 RepID=UPI003AF5C87D
MKEEKMTPRLASTARALWLIYLSLTAACAFAYWLFGMEPFDAIAHSLSTVSTGGFSTHDDSLSWFHSSQIEGVAILFMLLASLNFGVHYYAIYRRKPLHYWEDIEARSFLILVLVIVVVVGLMLRLEGSYHTLPPSLRDASFEVVSVITSRCQPWRAKRRLVDPSSREAALFSRRALRQRENKVGLRT